MTSRLLGNVQIIRSSGAHFSTRRCVLVGILSVALQPCRGRFRSGFRSRGSLRSSDGNLERNQQYGDAANSRPHRYAYLRNGTVLVAGGIPQTDSAEIYDPATGTWSSTGSLRGHRSFHTATRLSGGDVLVAGGIGSSPLPVASAEVYHVNSGTWSVTGPLVSRHGGHTATLLPNGQVLLAGGSVDNHGTVTATAELYDPTSHTWSQTGSLTTARALHTAALLRSGQVLVAGGDVSINTPTAAAELYNPASGTWSETASLNMARDYHTATRLRNGSVLVVGGFGGGSLCWRAPNCFGRS